LAKKTIHKQPSHSNDSETSKLEKAADTSTVAAESNENSAKEAAALPKSDEKSKENSKGKLADKKDMKTMILYGIGVLISAFIAFYIRIIPRDSVFLESGFIRFGENDPWYHWRNVDYLLHNYPNMLWFDPATTYPFGTSQAFAPLHDIILATVIKILQALTGNTTEAFAMTIAAYWPCVLAGVCVIVAYFVAKTLFNSRPIGLISAFLLAIAPGQFLSRSIIGFSDHHVTEVLFSSLVILFLIMTLLKARDKNITFDDITKGKFTAIKPILPYAVLTGIAMGAYTLVWEGALLFAFIIGVYITVQMMINHLRGEGTAFIAVTGIIIFAIDFILVWITPQIGEYKTLHMMALGAGILAIIFMAVLSFVLEKKNLHKILYPVILAGLAIAVSIVGSLISSTVRNALVGVVGFFTRTGGALTIGEASPYFGLPPEVFTVLIAVFLVVLPFLAISNKNLTIIKKGFLISWAALFFMIILAAEDIKTLNDTFSIMGFIWIFTLPIITYTAVKNNRMEKILLVIWTIILLWAMVQQNRFTYYFVVPAVIFTAWLFVEIVRAVKADEAWQIIKNNYLSGSRKKKEEPVVYSSRQEKARSQRDSKIKNTTAQNNDPTKIVIAVVVILIAAILIFAPVVNKTSQYIDQYTTYGTGGPPDAWVESSLWIRDNTPEIGLDWHAAYTKPIQDADGDGIEDSTSGIGIEHFENQASTVPFDYPGNAYGVLSWWDYGHWLEVIGERMVNSNPFQFGVGGRRGNITDEMMPGAAPFFVAETEKDATGYLVAIDPREDKVGARYIVTDIEMASGMSKFFAMTAWTLDTADYARIINIDGIDQQIIASDRYFNSMVFRLHMLDGVGLEQYRLVHESRSENSYAQYHETFYKQLYNQIYSKTLTASNTGYVKTFEFVEGATITGTAAPNADVELSLTVQTNQNRLFNYNQTVKTDSTGSFSFTVPYSTTGPIAGETNFAVKPNGNYIITSGSAEGRVDVTENDVLNGRTVSVSLS